MMKTYLAFILLSISVQLTASEKVITFAAENSWPPYADSQGNGISKTLIQQALKGSKFRPEFIAVPYARALQMTEYGEVHGCFNVTRQTDTEDKFLFGEQALLVAHASYFYSAKNVKNYSSVDEIPDGASIGLILGYEYGNEYEKQRHRFREFRVSSQEQIIRMLLSGRVDMAIMFDEVAAYHLDMLNLSEDDVIKGARNHSSDIYVALSRKKAESAEIAKALDKGLAKIHSTDSKPAQ